jgi:hypothetical protein
MSQIQITSHIELPPPCGRISSAPFRELNVGQSFFLPTTKRINSTYWAKQTGFKYTCRYRTEKGVAGVRVWRLQ